MSNVAGFSDLKKNNDGKEGENSDEDNTEG